MNKPTKRSALVCLWCMAWLLLAPGPEARAGEKLERAGVGLAVTAGNALFLPLKAVSMVMGVSAAALSYLVTGGDTEVSRQVWEDSTAEPYVITPALARKAIGERPELRAEK
ncbi:MAG TPA: hypothetical protein VNN77_07035 [candidate division Zixibacteria bacterium]|nr:hypothetical protein [candidate division Zixibacteria bacterium]